MEKHIAQDCQSVDEPAKQEMSQLLMTKRLQVTCGPPSSCSMHVLPVLGLRGMSGRDMHVIQREKYTKQRKACLAGANRGNSQALCIVVMAVADIDPCRCAMT